MARIRTIKPDAFTSDSLNRVPRGTRWTFAGLWTYADDKGRGRDDARLIKAALYPIDDDTSLEDVAHDLDLLASIGGICRYVVEDRAYLHMPKWGHQKINRPTPAKSPPCPLHEDGTSGHVVTNEASLSTHGGLLEEDSLWGGESEGDFDVSAGPDGVSSGSVNPHGGLTEGSTWEGKGREGKGRDSCASTDVEREFDDWYSLYPRKRGRGQALKAYRAARKKASAETLTSAIRQQAQALVAKGIDYAPYPATWLNGERWEDQPDNVHHLPHVDDQGRPTAPLPPRTPFGG